jgi:hypothetical protein
MLAKVCSPAVNGIEAYPVEVEVNGGYGHTIRVRSFPAFVRPSGTEPFLRRYYPTLRRWAVLGCPSGPRCRRDLTDTFNHTSGVKPGRRSQVLRCGRILPVPPHPPPFPPPMRSERMGGGSVFWRTIPRAAARPAGAGRALPWATICRPFGASASAEVTAGRSAFACAAAADKRARCAPAFASLRPGEPRRCRGAWRYGQDAPLGRGLCARWG